MKTSLAARQPGGHRIPEVVGLQGTRQSSLRSRRLRLHHLHRQLRSSPDPIAETVRKHDLVAVSVLFRQPQLRGPRESGRAGELPGLGHRSSSPMRWPFDQCLTSPPNRWGTTARQGRLPQGHLAAAEEVSNFERANVTRKASRRALQGRVQGRCRLAQDQGHGRSHVRM